MLFDPFELGVDQGLALLGLLEIFDAFFLDIERALEGAVQRRVGRFFGHLLFELLHFGLELSTVDAGDGLLHQLARGEQPQKNGQQLGKAART